MASAIDETTIDARLPQELAGIASELVAGGSLEMGAHRLADAAAIASHLPVGTCVYVNHLPRHGLADTLDGLVAVRAAGLEPVPHLAARRLASRRDAESFLQAAVSRAGVKKVLLIGGDTSAAAGPYSDAAALMADGVLRDCGIREVGFAGYPEGHLRIPGEALEDALARKLELADAQGIGPYVVTQFSFAPTRVTEFCGDLARKAPGVPVYVGMVGPTSPATLLKFAQQCGVSASIRALQAQGFGAVKLFAHTDPREQLAVYARYCAAHPQTNIVGVHVFSFGGASRAAAWMQECIAGRAQAC